MKNYKATDGHQFFKSGWVQTIVYHRPANSTMLVLKADVRPSWIVNDEEHHPWVAVTSDGTISCAHCDCKPGLGESCSHVAAVLFKAEAAARLGYTKTACTDEPCRWNDDYVKKVVPAPISKVYFYKDSAIDRVKKRKQVDPKEKATDTEQQSLLQTLSECKSKLIVLSTFQGYSEPFHWKQKPPATVKLPQSLRTLYDSSLDRKEVSEDHVSCALNKMQISPEQKQFVFDSTKGQSDSLVWREQQVGRITSSTVHRVLHTDKDNPSKSLILSICKESKNISTDAINWGKENETNAIKEYTKVMKSAGHTEVATQKSGLLISETYSFIGASADSLSSCACHGKRVVEVKCPFTHRDISLQEYLAHKSSCLGTTPSIHLKESHSYYTQVQMQIMVHNVEGGDFVIWTPKFVIVLHVFRNNTFIQNMIEQAISFYKRHIIPELLTRTIENSPHRVPKKENCAPLELFCYCRKPESGDMIGCDNPDCKYMWFHMSCVKLKRAPKGSWFFKSCRKQQ